MKDGRHEGAAVPAEPAKASEPGCAELRAASHYLVGLDLRGRPVLVVGGGAVAIRKVRGLRAAGADVTVVAPAAGDLPEDVTLRLRPFQESDLDGVLLAIAATDDPVVNTSVAAAATRRGVWVNVVDDPSAGTVVVPAEVRRGMLRVAVSTGGASPALARRLREQLELQFGPEYAVLVHLLAKLRTEWEQRAVAAGLSQSRRAEAWRAVLDAPLLGLLREGRQDDAEAAARAVLEQHLAPPD